MNFITQKNFMVHSHHKIETQLFVKKSTASLLVSLRGNKLASLGIVYGNLTCERNQLEKNGIARKKKHHSRATTYFSRGSGFKANLCRPFKCAACDEQ